MNKVSLKSLFQTRTITALSEVKKSTEGNLYLTVYGKKGATNIWFGKNSAKQVTVGVQLSNDAILNMEIVQSVNAQGETRFKASLPKLGVLNLASLFDEGEMQAEFDLALFESQFAAAKKPETGA